MRSLLPLLSLLLLCGCHAAPPPLTDAASVRTDSVVPLPPIRLADRAYRFGPIFTDSTCRVETPCDCCETDVLFTDQEHFIAIFLCLQDNTYAHGSYRVEADRVYLSYEGYKVDEITDMTVQGDTLAVRGDTVLSSRSYQVDTMPHSIDTLRAFVCGGVVGFRSQTIDIGMPGPPGSAAEQLKRLHADSIPERMGLH